MSMERMEIRLRELPFDKVEGIYTIGGVPRKMPKKALFMEPEAADAFVEIADFVPVSDMLRSAESSLQAVLEGRGALRPGKSGHNMGKSTDGEVDEMMKRVEVKTKKALDDWMASKGFFNFWTDGQMTHVINGKKTSSEIWHYNYFGVGFKIENVRTTTGYLEAEIKKLYEPFFRQTLGNPELQQDMLAELKFYGGEIDGIVGPRTKQAVRAFQRAWKLDETGGVDYDTARLLAFVTHKKVIV